MTLAETAIVRNRAIDTQRQTADRNAAMISKAPAVSGVKNPIPVTSEVKKAVADARPTTTTKNINKPEEEKNIFRPT